MLIQTYQSQEPSVAKEFHDDDDPNNLHNDHDGGGYRVRVNDDENHNRDCDIHRVHENDGENHDGDYDVHVFMRMFFMMMYFFIYSLIQ